MSVEDGAKAHCGGAEAPTASDQERSVINEHEQVVLTRDLSGHGLVAGDIAVVVAVHQGGDGYTLEFMTVQGETVAIVTVDAADVRPALEREVPHVRAAE
jgi:hypothetical protein